MKKPKAVPVTDITWARPPAPPAGAHVVPAPGQPMRVARELVKALYTLPVGILLRSHRGDFFRWDGTRYSELDRRDVRRAAYEHLEHAVYLHPKDGWLPFAPTQRKTTDVLDALQAVVFIESRPDAPLWIDRRDQPPAAEIVAMTNGLLHVPTRILHAHTTQYFNQHALPFAFDPKAPTPTRWLAFLDELWPDDATAVDGLQEVIGYLLAGDTRQQKIFGLVGPPRSGKGTIARVITGLLGAHQVAAPTLASLATNFGLQPLIAKPLAIIADARLSTRADSKVIVERLLSISGEDSLTIDRKYKDPWTGRLPTRLLILTNELPKLSDASGALASRFILFVLATSFIGRENPQLTAELLTEAPSIFNWALEGAERLITRGYFERPASSADAVRQMEDLSSPIAAFVRDRCVVNVKAEVPVEALWTAWKAWCVETNTRVNTKALLGRDLRAAVPRVKIARPRHEGDRVYRYQGIGLLPQENNAFLPGPPGPEPAAGPGGPGGPGNSAMYPSHRSSLTDEVQARGDERFQQGWQRKSEDDDDLLS
jgi:putative DNA primase/helicase